jgi:hypothetical protein
LSDALSPQGLAYCPADSRTACPSPPLLTWTAIRPGWVVIGAMTGAVLGLILHALQSREQRRRESVGEQTPFSA